MKRQPMICRIIRDAQGYGNIVVQVGHDNGNFFSAHQLGPSAKALLWYSVDLHELLRLWRASQAERVGK